jgi:outer membrane protein insertion porin family
MTKLIQSAWAKALGAIVVLALAALGSRLVLAQTRGDGEVVAEVRVTGNQVIKIEKIMTYIHTRAGHEFNKSKIYEDVERLIKSKLFKDVRLEIQKVPNGSLVTFHMYEQPNTVLDVIFRNVHHIPQKDLDEMTMAIRKGNPLNPAVNIKAARDIQDYLKMAKGRYWANVTLEEGARATDRRVVFNISEGPVLRVRSTSFVGGGELATQARLRVQIQTSRSFWGFSGIYSEAIVDGDVKKLEDYYFANGYRFAKVTRELQFSLDYSQVDVIFHIHAGVRTRIEAIEIRSLPGVEPIFSQTQLKGALPNQLHSGEWFNKGVMDLGDKSLETYIGWRGYNPKISTEVFEGSAPGLVHVVYGVEMSQSQIVKVGTDVPPPQPAKVANIYVVGNEVTQDRVILRLLGLYPGQTLRYPEVKLGEAALARSNLFEIKKEEEKPTITVLEPNDGYGVYKDILVRVKETQTGSFMVGAGINSNAGLMGNIVLNERNFDLFRPPTTLQDIWDGRAFRGAGQEFRIEAVPGTLVQRYTVSFREPYLFDRPYSLTTSFYYFERFYDEDIEERLGGRITLAHTLTNTWPDFFAKLFDGPVLQYLRESRYALSVNAGIRIEDVVVSGLTAGAPIDYTAAYGHNLVVGPRVGATWDTRDSFLRPTTGGIIDLSAEADFGSFQYQLYNITASRYFTIWERPDGSGKHVLAFRSQISFASSDTPVFDRYYAGGYGSIRGFQFRGVGPDVVNYEVGGDFMLLNSIEYQIPVVANDQFYLVAFIDSGTVQSNVEILNYRVSAGVGMRLALPMLGPLPLALDVGVPIVYAQTDHREYISFSVGFFH